MGSVALIALIFGALVLAPMAFPTQTDTDDDIADDMGDDPLMDDPDMRDPAMDVPPMDDEMVDDAPADDPVVGPMDNPDAEPVDPATLGATFAETGDGVMITFGENEPGRLAIFTYVDTQDSADDFLAIHEARYYLVPDGVVWPDNTSETADTIPGADTVAGGAYLLADFEAAFGLTLLGTQDLLAAGNDMPTDTDMADALPDLMANRDADYYYLESNTDGDELITFLQEGYLETRNGVTETVVTASSTGSDTSDWLSSSADGVTLDGAGGDDTLEGSGTDLALLGGDGNDAITAQATGARIEGGAGDDTVIANVGGAVIDTGDGNDDVRATTSVVTLGAGDDSASVLDASTVFGGDGTDVISSNGAASILFGGAGGDNVFGTGTGAEFYGGAGDDFVGAEAGSTAFGGSGSDLLQVGAGGTGDAGDGDDVIRVQSFFGDDAGAATVTGGAGADTFAVGIRNAFGEASDPVFTEITDFNSAEDMLVIDRFNSGPEVDRITVTEDPDGAFTDIEVFFDQPESGADAVSTIVRLAGVTGFDASQVVIGTA